MAAVNSVAWYDANADTVASRYEAIASENIHGWLANMLPAAPATVMDVGAGTGRDAAWLAGKGYNVVAVEPSTGMRANAARLHPDVPIQWINDSLPALETVTRSALSFDLILLSAVWMHVAAGDRPRAFRKLINLLKPGGLIVISLRLGQAEPARGMHPVSLVELETLARDHGAFVERSVHATDQQGRSDIRWTQVAIRLPDDGTGALPLLRHVILNDDKSSTYKLALLRTICRVADGAAGFARDHDDEFVAVPMGLVALTWIRLFRPLLKAGFPQSPSNLGYERLGFVKEAFVRLTEVSHLDLRVGMSFSGDIAAALHQSLKDAADTIARMPATYMTYANGGAILSVTRTSPRSRLSRILVDQAYLASFGEMLVPRHLWMALRRFDVWVEPALIAEWTRLTKTYAARQGRRVDDAALAVAMTWQEPSRDVRAARERAICLSERRSLYCTWSGKRLVGETLDLDHCFPWSIWPCGDLWNLMPAHRTVNQREKRARMPSDSLLRAAADRIIHWWGAAYIEDDPMLAERFWLEAQSSLPMTKSTSIPGELFDAVSLQRMRLAHDQQVPEWTGDKYVAAIRSG
ncbi:methyltransferase domain-containing protein [Mesorhizobium sp.]|uniref:methyltransferase domain-containing protein n=1 Tax=Mesorhizobium sp. TaxID=1871066 RepID=UPI000FE673A8|nr:methyltransferase domain-containing protein [Mesorhizobium sp.]RWP64137.1 MAG: methyltransferase domain-containing protein [Mesorhizobium sp.]